MAVHSILSFYEFKTLETSSLSEISSNINILAEKHNVLGLLILGPEGFNSTLSGRPEDLENFLQALRDTYLLKLDDLKRSESEKAPFAKFRICRRDEIVTLGEPQLRLDAQDSAQLAETYFTAKEFHEALESQGWNVLDTRNWYETKIGRFKNATDPKISEFSQFTDYLKTSDLDKNKPTLIYCTGGIRCEKAILQMHQSGFTKVRQLQGGILKYLEEFPNQGFDGECFVFDRRLAVDQKLRPTQTYAACPHCGQPARETLQCIRCDDTSYVCEECRVASEDLRTCSKNCAHHWRLAPGKKGRSQRISRTS